MTSVLTQAFSRNDVEVVVVDDGSTDDTWLLLKSMAEEEPVHVCFTKTTRGRQQQEMSGPKGREGFSGFWMPMTDWLTVLLRFLIAQRLNFRAWIWFLADISLSMERKTGGKIFL